MRDRTWCGVASELAVVAVMAMCAAPGVGAADDGKPDFILREQLGHGWSNECVSFPLGAEQLQAAKAGKALVDNEGRQVAYQLVTSGDTARISFQVDQGPYQ
jgi:hypothetical protein